MAGFDGVLIHGCSPRPVYLWIKDGNAEIRDASNFWGKDTGVVQEGIREELGDKRIRVAQCGPSGIRTETLSGITSVSNRRTGTRFPGEMQGMWMKLVLLCKMFIKWGMMIRVQPLNP